LWQFWRNWVNASSSTGDRASCRTTLSWFICWQASQWEENIHTIFMLSLKQYNYCTSMSLCWMKNPQCRLLPTCSISTLGKPRFIMLIHRYLKIHIRYFTLDIWYLTTNIWDFSELQVYFILHIYNDFTAYQSLCTSKLNY
jgi:hypothetical protein